MRLEWADTGPHPARNIRNAVDFTTAERLPACPENLPSRAAP